MLIRLEALPLLLSYSVRRANSSAGTAVNAGVSFDYIDITFSDAVNGTFRLAGSASYAVVVYYVWHFSSFS